MFINCRKARPLLQHIRYQSSTSFGIGHVHTLKNKSGDNVNKYPVSFLNKEQVGEQDLTQHDEFIMGWTPTQDQVDPKTFVPNDKFLDYVTEVFSENIHKVNDTSLKGMAQWQKEGWLHVADERNPPPWGRIPKPEDIIGSVLLQDGQMQAGSYQAMPAYRLVTKKGLMQLSPPLKACLVEAAKQKLK